MLACVPVVVLVLSALMQDDSTERKGGVLSDYPNAAPAFEQAMGRPAGSRDELARCPDTGVRAAFVRDCTAGMKALFEQPVDDLFSLEGGEAAVRARQQAPDELATPFDLKRQIWAMELRTILTAAAPLAQVDEWQAEHVALGEALAAYIALGPDAPDFVFEGGAATANLEELGRIFAWFDGRMRDPAWRAGMILTFDDGPYRPTLVESPGPCTPAESRPVGSLFTLRTCQGDAEQPKTRLQAVREDGSVAWTCDLPRVPARASFNGNVEEEGPWGWVVPLSFGERVTLYLDADARPSFYFVSW